MNTVAKLTEKTAFALTEPDISPRLRSILDDFIPSQGFVVTREADKLEAQLALPHYALMLKPQRAGIVRHWLDALAMGVRNPPSEEEIAMRVAAVTSMLSDLPVGVWTKDTLERAGRAFKFWPSVADLNDLLRPVADSLARRHRNAERVAAAGVANVRPVSAEQERAYIDQVASARVQARQNGEADEQGRSGGEGQGPLPDTGAVRETLVASYTAALADPDPMVQQAARVLLTRLQATADAAGQGSGEPGEDQARPDAGGLRRLASVVGLA
jgi:hypothetical protein